MGWTETARREHDRSRLRYTSDCTDAEWAIIAPLLARTTKVGRPRLHRARDLWNAIQYLAATGCQWAQLPRDFPPFTTVQYHFYRMRDSGLLDAINAVLVAGVRIAEGREAEPTAGIIERCRDAYPPLSRFFADGGYAGQKLAAAIAHIDHLAIEIVRRSDAHRFVVLPRRWVVERTIAWLNRCRRLAKDWEASVASAEAWLIIASIRRMTRRIAKLEL